MAAANRARGALEQEVLASLAAVGKPMSAAEVQAEMGTDLAYTTVVTTLARLHAKHALTRTQVGRAYQYSLAGGRAGAKANIIAHQMLRLLDRDHDRAGVLSRFVADLSVEDERLLTELLARDAGDDD